MRHHSIQQRSENIGQSNRTQPKRQNGQSQARHTGQMLPAPRWMQALAGTALLVVCGFRVAERAGELHQPGIDAAQPGSAVVTMHRADVVDDVIDVINDIIDALGGGSGSGSGSGSGTGSSGGTSGSGNP